MRIQAWRFTLPPMARVAGLGLLLCCACGARTGLHPFVDAEPQPLPMGVPEICNGLDDDLDVLQAGTGPDSGALDGGLPDSGSPDGDIQVDEDFRDELGRYVHPEHCGGCNRPCRPDSANELATECVVIEETAVCAATECTVGFAPSRTGRCVPIFDRLCLSCTDDGECGDLEIAACDDVAGEQRCVVGCDFGCPLGFLCTAGRCIPSSGSCTCEVGDRFDFACPLLGPEGNRCPGSSLCDNGELSMCEAPPEVCDERDNDCDGEVDETFRDARGAYILDIRNCGECGVDCTLSTLPEGDLICGGDPFAPTCVLRCPDAEDGIMPGDRIDADRDVATGCECTVGSLSDVPGPVGAEGEDLDVNCDGADGIVVESYYVAPDGDDGGPGSPTRPLKTIGEGLERAAESLGSDAPRSHIFVASGSYAETLELRDGVQLHGGYRRDFLALDPTGFRVDVRAPTDTSAPGGAAAIGRDDEVVGVRDTVVEWVTLHGRDGLGPSAAAFGVYLLEPGPGLTFREMEIVSGVPGSGTNGTSGESGAAPTSAAQVGGIPREALESAAHECLAGPGNQILGGEGGINQCDGAEVHGGRGGGPSCPSFSENQPSGQPGSGASPGQGGAGGQDSMGPITGGPSCLSPPCCGLADFTVPTEFGGPQSGTRGGDGQVGSAGRGCNNPFGALVFGEWTPDVATEGSPGTPGSGGGGGGAGGGAEMQWFDVQCEHEDGLGGGGGGGGAGGCGGRPGFPGTSGAPSAAVVFEFHDDGPLMPPSLSGVTLRSSDGGRGGDGGAGGDGGRGGVGALGGEVPRAERSTPSLAGPFPGGRGGRGGDGGPGGGAGGGCGGASVGIWAIGGIFSVDAWRADNTFVVGRGGLAGQGGGGGAAAADGAEGGAHDVLH